MKFTDYIHPLYFFIALFVTLIGVMALAPERKLVVKEVTLDNHQDLVFKKQDDSCYRYKKEEVSCK
jgi:hypothetical protein